MGQDGKIVETNERIFEIREVAGPEFALKQQGDANRVAAGPVSGIASHSELRA